MFTLPSRSLIEVIRLFTLEFSSCFSHNFKDNVSNFARKRGYGARIALIVFKKTSEYSEVHSGKHQEHVGWFIVFEFHKIDS